MGGFSGLRIVSEGDSWFQYPITLTDIIDNLSADPDKAILSLGAAGDTVANMARRAEFLRAVERENASVLLLSAGGNDLLGDGALAAVLNPFSQGAEAKELVNWTAFGRRLDSIVAGYESMIRAVEAGFPRVKVFGHGYDLPFPQTGGPWLGTPLKAKGIPPKLGREVIRHLIDAFNDRLGALEHRYTGYTHIDLRGKVGGSASSWHDELHPKNAGYGRAANAFREQLGRISEDSETGSTLERGLLSGLAALFSPDDPRTEEQPQTLDNTMATIVLDPGHGGDPPPTRLGGSSWNNASGPNGTLEKNVTLDVARRTRDVLEQRGHTVVLTRDSDTNLSLRDRAAVAQTRAAPVFVSIHFNGFNNSVQGTETFAHNTSRAISDELCVNLQARVVAATGYNDRNASHPGGVKRGAFGVISQSRHHRDTACVLLEVSFMDVAAEETRLADANYLRRIATAIADGIDDYLGDEESFRGEDSFEDGFEAGAAGARVDSPTFESPAMFPRHHRGHHIAETDGGADENFIRVLRSFGHGRTRGSWGDQDDVNEFQSSQIGEAPFEGFGADLEADTRRLRRIFPAREFSAFDLGDFEDFIEGLGLQFFQPAEFLFMGAGNESGACAGLNHFPARALWDNIAHTAQMLDEIRRRLNAPVRILSCYRSPAYNDCVGGASGSLHMNFNAIDWTCSSGSASAWRQVARDVRASNQNWVGGIGFYPSSNFIHVDTRGTEANWQQ